MARNKVETSKAETEAVKPKVATATTQPNTPVDDVADGDSNDSAKGAVGATPAVLNMTADSMRAQWKIQDAHCKAERIKRLALSHPEVKDLLAEVAALKAKIATK